MPRSPGLPTTSYPLSDLPDKIPDRCSMCHRKLKKKGFILINSRRSATFLYLCTNCTKVEFHHPYENKPYINAIGQELIEIYNGLLIFKANNQATTVQIEFPNIREARTGVAKIKEALLMYTQCPCCANMVAKLETHHWWQPPMYTYHTKGVCPHCNQRYLNPKIWEYHPKYDGIHIPSHLMPSWEVQKVYRENENPKLLTHLLDEYELPLPLPTGKDARQFLGIKYYRDYWNKYGYSIYDRSDNERTVRGEQLLKLETEIYNNVGHQFNINSDDQLNNILFGELALPREGKSHSITDDMLDTLCDSHPIIALLLEYRRLVKTT